MTRLLLITLLLLSNGPAYGKWIEFIGSDQVGVTVYVDPDTIHRNGDLVKMWYLVDFKTVQTVEGVSYLSSTGQNEFNCAEEHIRVLVFTHFSGNMGHGDAVYTYSGEQQWEPVAPRTVNQRLWKAGCSKK